ncbi:hypothetical protein EVAR_4765_1 [Eumeta japonica]|uniref:Uncharacterized protein n=1 Tax=Eumeta variegata TaxID=151549 RepID=A0A4C1SYW1_EUMVA|nr:hypothetical protein EVAR_4765_1 [Eumeta japonica]
MHHGVLGASPPSARRRRLELSFFEYVAYGPHVPAAALSSGDAANSPTYGGQYLPAMMSAFRKRTRAIGYRAKIRCIKIHMKSLRRPSAKGKMRLSPYWSSFQKASTCAYVTPAIKEAVDVS